MLDVIGVAWVALGAELFLMTQWVILTRPPAVVTAWMAALGPMSMLVYVMAAIRFGSTPLKSVIENWKGKT